MIITCFQLLIPSFVKIVLHATTNQKCKITSVECRLYFTNRKEMTINLETSTDHGRG